MNYRKVFYWSITVALGGFLFGLDTAVISGCERTIQQRWSLSDAMTGQMVAMALYGTIVGAIFGGLPAERYGRKPPGNPILFQFPPPADLCQKLNYTWQEASQGANAPPKLRQCSDIWKPGETAV
jgi:hypothetical protein